MGYGRALSHCLIYLVEGIAGPIYSKAINKIIINYKFPISRRDDMQDWLARAKGLLQDRLEEWLSQNKDQIFSFSFSFFLREQGLDIEISGKILSRSIINYLNVLMMLCAYKRSKQLHEMLQPSHGVCEARESISYRRLYRFDQQNDIFRYQSILVYRFRLTIIFYIYKYINIYNKYKSLP